MAGIAAGVVTAGDVSGQPAMPSKWQLSLQAPATWSYIWFGVSVFYLVGVYFGMISIARRA
jgi:hypothetical protein